MVNRASSTMPLATSELVVGAPIGADAAVESDDRVDPVGGWTRDVVTERARHPVGADRSAEGREAVGERVGVGAEFADDAVIA
jgi:hypothetical protein